MTDYAVQVVMPNVSGLAKDSTVNTWAFRSNQEFDQDNANNIRTLLANFYNDANADGDSISQFLSARLSRTETVKVKCYRLSTMGDEEPPEGEAEFLLENAVETSSLPAEVALCASFAGDTSTGLLLRRRRGRVYIGPLANAAASTGANQVCRPNADFQNAVNDAMAHLSALAFGVAEWCVWSRVANEMTPVERGWVDNEWDTQRRRGLRATNRVSWNVVP